MIEVLVVEDDENYRFEIQEEIESALKGGCSFHYASNLQQAITCLRTQEIDLVLTDIIFPLDDLNQKQDEVDYTAGVKLVENLQKANFQGHIVVLSSQDKNFAVDLLIRFRNVTDYVFKDASWKEILHKIQKQIQILETQKQLRAQLGEKHPLIGNSNSVQQIQSLAKKLATLDTTILIMGESGVGKEVAARHFHMVSSRSTGPFVVVNCAAIPESLFESHFFGHAKGAFTGAENDSRGAFESAHGGTLFLDEIGELPLLMQAKLLRVLQEKQVTPVGGQASIDVEVRVIAATNRSLEEAVEKKEFREDLYYRINGFPLEIEPLRSRPDDVALLCEHFLESLYQKTGIRRTLSPKVESLLLNYGWPGNIRELKNTLERLVILTDHECIEYDDAMRVLQFTAEEDFRVQFPHNLQDYKEAKQGVLDAFHKQFFSYHLKANGNQISKTAEAIGYNRNDLSNAVKKLGIPTK